VARLVGPESDLQYISQRAPVHDLANVRLLRRLSKERGSPSAPNMSLAMAVASATVMSSASMVTPAMTTAFTPAPTTCLQNQLTMLENQNYEIWMNYPLPVQGTTFSECYPTQFMSSFLASASGTTAAPAFSPLVCPSGYSTVATSWIAAPNYIACCPRSVFCRHSF
jgi:hypothetical protein